MSGRPEMPMAVSLVLVTAAFAVIVGVVPLLLRLDSLQRDVATLQELGRPAGFIYRSLAFEAGTVVMGAVTFFVVLFQRPRIGARWGLALHALMLLALLSRHGFGVMKVLESQPIRVAWLVVVGILLLPFERFRIDWDPEPAPGSPAIRYRIPLATRTLLALMVLVAGAVFVFFGGWMLAGLTTGAR